MKRHLNIIARTNGVGLDRDVSLIREIAETAGYEVTVSHSRGISALARWLPQRKRFSANIFLERIFPRWLGAAGVNILIPNQERFPQRHVKHLSSLDAIFCKSRHALEIFSEVHPTCHFTGFTSENLYDGKVPRKEKTFLHLAGKSTLKGTEVILDLWKRHPEWPLLTLVQTAANAPDAVPENVTLLSEYLSNEEIALLYNSHPFHLCPSRSEGWGHYLVEAMHCGALVITTNGPPMNEIITPERGLLISAARSEPRHLGTNFYIDRQALEAAIEAILATDPTKLQPQREAAKAWAAQNEIDFRRRLTTALKETLSDQSTK